MKIGLDTDVAAVLVADMVRSGINILRGSQVKSFVMPTVAENSANNGVRVPIRINLEGRNGDPVLAGQPTEIKCDTYLAAVGRKPNTANLNLGAAGIDTDDYGGIIVNARLETSSNDKNVYAAGDVLGRPFLASTGSAQGVAAIAAMFGTPDEDPIAVSTCDPDDELCVDGDISKAGEGFDPGSLAANPFAFPTAIWSSPEAAYYGLTLPQAKALDIDAAEAISLYVESLRGRVFSPNGILKLVYEKPFGRVIGVHICGDDACELIHYGMELVKAKRTIKDIHNCVFSAVTFHEMYKIAAEAALDEKGARKRRAAAGAAVAQRNRLQAQSLSGNN